MLYSSVSGLSLDELRGVLWVVVGLIDAHRWRRASRSRFSTALIGILSSYFFFFAGKRSPSLSCGADFSSPSATRHQTAIAAPCSRARSRLAPARHYSLLWFALPLISLHFLLYGGQGLVPPVPAARGGFAGRLVSFPGLLLRGVTCCADLHLAFYLEIWGRIQFPLGGGSAMKIVYDAIVSVPWA
jgi:hypothetical protein